jgi:hypothetical protein
VRKACSARRLGHPAPNGDQRMVRLGLSTPESGSIDGQPARGSPAALGSKPVFRKESQGSDGEGREARTV